MPSARLEAPASRWRRPDCKLGGVPTAFPDESRGPDLTRRWRRKRSDISLLSFSYPRFILVPSSRSILPASAHRSEIATNGWWEGDRVGRGSLLSRPKPRQAGLALRVKPLENAPTDRYEGRRTAQAPSCWSRTKERTYGFPTKDQRRRCGRGAHPQSSEALSPKPRPLRRGRASPHCGLPASRRRPRRGRFPCPDERRDPGSGETSRA